MRLGGPGGIGNSIFGRESELPSVIQNTLSGLEQPDDIPPGGGASRSQLRSSAERTGRFNEFVAGRLSDVNDIPFRTMGLSEKQQVFRTFESLPDEIRSKVDLENPRHATALQRVGNLGPNEFKQLMSQEPDQVWRDIKERQPSAHGGNLMSRIGGIAIPALTSLLMGPVAGAVMGTALGGAQAGTIEGLGMSAGVNLAGLGVGGAIGGFSNLAQPGALGQVLSGIGGAAQSSGQMTAAQASALAGGTDIARSQAMANIANLGTAAGAASSATAGITNPTLRAGAQQSAGGATTTGTNLSSVFNRGKEIVQGPVGQIGKAAGRLGLSTREEIVNRGAIDQAFDDRADVFAQQQSSSQTRGLQRQPQGSIFSHKLPDSAFYDPFEDLTSGQGDLV
jgi:hypothetical protein